MSTSYRHLLALTLSAVVALLAACSTPAESPPPAADLTGTTWVAEAIDGQGVLDQVRSTLAFDAVDRVSGSGGCNRFFGPVRIDGVTIAFGPLASTRMACPPPLDAQEQRFFATLDRVRAFRRDGSVLVLKDDGDRELVRLIRQP